MQNINRNLREVNNFPNNNNNNIRCVVCHNPANKYCERCDDPYCSEICQKIDWSGHRYICFPMPNLTRKYSVTQGEQSNVLSPKSIGHFNEVSRSVPMNNLRKQNDNALKEKIPNINGQSQMNQSYNKEKVNSTDFINSNKNHTIPQENNIKSPVLKAPFKFADIDESEKNFDLVVLDTSSLEEGCIGGIPKKDLIKLRRIQQYLMDYGITHKQPYTPIENEYCIASYDNEWFRARVINILDNKKFKVAYIDYTNEDIVSIECIRRYPEELIEDCCSYLCFFEGLNDPPTSKQVKFLNDNIKAETIIKIDSATQLDQGFIGISCNPITNHMKQLSLI